MLRLDQGSSEHQHHAFQKGAKPEASSEGNVLVFGTFHPPLKFTGATLPMSAIDF